MSAFPKIEAFVWSDKLATGIVEVDAQHRRLVELINEVGNLCAVGRDGVQLKPVLDELVSYTQYHFDTEEQLMRQYGVSTAHQENHFKAHEAFRQQVVLAIGIIENSPQNTMSLLAELLEYLARWLLQHIMVVDLRMAREIQALQAGASHQVAASQASAIVSQSGDVMLEALNTLYSKIGEKTVEVMQTNQALEREREALRKLNEQLEARVISRTAALEEANHQLVQNNSELKILNQKLESAQGHLLQSEKMASLGQLAAGVAHELNNPIGFVYSNMGTLEAYVNDIFVINAALEEVARTIQGDCPALDQVSKLKQDRDYEYIRQDIFQLMAQSKDGLARMRKIVQDLKDFSHVGDEGWKWVDLHQGIDSTLNIVWNELKYKCQIVKEYGQLPEVYCMPSQINQVLLNMLVNAGQAIENKGIITIRTGAAENQVWVEIEDTGRGIPADEIERIFDPFYTTKPVGVGTGLGLSLSFGIMQKHQGRIEVKSTVGRGTSMRICLPVKPA
ncbi:MAG: bacteriohemerythrin [Gallionella sp.]|jgi:hemerythrin-like metal-binding protein